MRTPITNGLIAISTFFLILFVIMTIHSYEKALSNVQIKTPKTSVSDVTIRHPTADMDEVKEFKHATITREELGNKAWHVLHLITGNYPVEPDEADQKNIEIFLKLFAQYYPCKECGGHFYEKLEKYPVEAKSRKELMHYLCKLHNLVNKDLHKPQFDCNTVEEKWSDCGCKEGQDVDID